MQYKEKLEKLSSSAEERKKCFKELLKHIENGFSMDCFEMLSEVTIYEFMKKYPSEFCEGELQEAMRKGKLGWERLGRRQSDGTCLGNSRAWYYNMVNRYGWRERQEIKAEHAGQVQVNVV